MQRLRNGRQRREILRHTWYGKERIQPRQYLLTEAAWAPWPVVAHPQSLQRAMLITAAMYAVSGVLFLLTARTLKSDLVAR